MPKKTINLLEKLYNKYRSLICGGYIVRKRGKVKVLLVVIIGIILLLIPITIQANGWSSDKVINKYVAMGDLVALDCDDEYEVSYVSLIKDFLESLNEDLSYYNLSDNKITSSELIDIIDNNKDEIRNSNLITISIGGNNVLNSILQNLYSNLNIDEKALENYEEEEFDLLVSELLNSDTIISEIQKDIDIFENDFPSIIEKVQKLAPKAEIYVNTVYNPINKKGNIYDFFDEQISLINEIIIKNNNKYDYKIIDCYNILNNDEGERLNLQVCDGEVVLYPNKVGHAMMATQVITDYEDCVNLEVDKITTTSENIKGKTVPNSNIIVVSEDGTVGMTQAKQNGEFEIKISPMVSGTNLEILVYDKKVFSILYKFEKLVVKKDLFTS